MISVGGRNHEQAYMPDLGTVNSLKSTAEMSVCDHQPDISVLMEHGTELHEDPAVVVVTRGKREIRQF